MAYRLPGFEFETEHRRILEARADAIREEHRRLLDARKEIDNQLEAIQRHLRIFNPYLVEYGIPPISEIPEAEQSVTPIGKTGNRGDAMPPRRESFRDVSLYDAITSVLRERGAMHADSLAQVIFETDTRDDVRWVKRSLVSSLSRGAQEGRWERFGPGKYRLRTMPDGQSEQSVNGQTALRQFSSTGV